MNARLLTILTNVRIIVRLPDPKTAIFVTAEDARCFYLQQIRFGSIFAQNGLAVAPSSDKNLEKECEFQ